MQTNPPAPLAAVTLRKGLQCAALFDDKEDGGPKWFRVRVEAVLKGQGDAPQATVLYTDYGNRYSLMVVHSSRCRYLHVISLAV